MKDFMQSLRQVYFPDRKRPNLPPELWLMEQAQRRGWGYVPPNNSPADNDRGEDKRDKRWDRTNGRWQHRDRLTDKWIKHR